MNGSREVVEIISTTPEATGFAGIGDKVPESKWLAISREKGGKAELPTPDAIRSGAYPISRPLYFYTVGKPRGALKKFVDWVIGPGGQSIAQREGFVTLR